jgi:hypothetical protein
MRSIISQGKPGVNKTNENTGPTTAILQRENITWTGFLQAIIERKHEQPNRFTIPAS